MTLPSDAWAPHYERVMHLTFGDTYTSLTSTTLDVIRERLPSGGRVVDFGSGCGRLAIPLARDGYEVTAVDPSKAMLEELIRAAGPLEIDAVPVSMEAYATDHPHDLALCAFSVVAFLPDERRLRASMQAAAACLSAGGQLLVDVPAPEVFADVECDTAEMMRSVRLVPIGERRFRYLEETVLRGEEGHDRYENDFLLRMWNSEEVVDASERAGLFLEEDLSARFCGLGARYLLMRRRR